MVSAAGTSQVSFTLDRAKRPDRLPPLTFWGPLRFMPLRRYVHDNAYRTALPRDLLAALTPFFPNAQAVLTGFGARF